MARVVARRIYDHQRGHKHAWIAREAGAPMNEWLAFGKTEASAIAAGKRVLARKRKPNMARTKNMKLKAASPWAVTASRDDVEEFADQWPGSGMHGKPGFTAYFDTNGDLIDLSGWAYDFNGDQSALVALIDDMKAFGQTQVADAIGKSPGRRTKTEREVIGLLTGRSRNPRRKKRRGNPSEQEINDRFEELAGSVGMAYMIMNMAQQARQNVSGDRFRLGARQRSVSSELRKIGKRSHAPAKAIDYYIEHFLGE